MNSELMDQLRKDLKVNTYEGELTTYYECRLIYSALAEWMRFTVFDEVTDDYFCKSKAYILRRGIEVLRSFIGSSPALQQWFLEDEKGVHEFDAPVKEIRDRMLLAGEYFEFLPSHDLTIPSTERININDRFDRVIGTSVDSISNQIKYVGITKIVKTEAVKKDYDEFSLEQYMAWILKTAIWNTVKDIDKFEFFDAYSKKAPYKSWVDFPPNGMDYHLGRISLYNGLHEYYLFKKNKEGEWLNSQLQELLSETKEERRIILGLRMMCNNKAVVKYKTRGDVVELKLMCRLPIKEEILMETYCWPLRYYMDKLNYIVPVEVWPNIKHTLEVNLGMKIEEQ